jgi:hypothetical protein
MANGGHKSVYACALRENAARGSGKNCPCRFAKAGPA